VGAARQKSNSQNLRDHTDKNKAKVVYAVVPGQSRHKPGESMQRSDTPSGGKKKRELHVHAGLEKGMWQTRVEGPTHPAD